MAHHIPTGGIIVYPVSTAPNGYLKCDGTSYVRSDYQALFDVIGTTFGSADGTHFNVPDIKGKNIVGYDSGDASFDAVGETGGAKSINIQHSHTGAAHTHTTTGTSGSAGGGTIVLGSDTNTAFSNNGHTHPFAYISGARSVATSDNQLSTTQSILQPFITMQTFIKV